MISDISSILILLYDYNPKLLIKKNIICDLIISDHNIS